MGFRFQPSIPIFKTKYSEKIAKKKENVENTGCFQKMIILIHLMLMGFFKIFFHINKIEKSACGSFHVCCGQYLGFWFKFQGPFFRLG